ncbi:MAG: FAD-dependent oxidoreductase (4Fe-4S ferredoxin cluster binding protein) [Candidatus Magnetoglobus multicellularis str. Araruama]|uniref:Ion-translocating oxidoreductase complex subunit B n=1 Tax=Candidatus Magnetoglobus multicellularis str. Araruama TaxID=890399 RepID=A0A1V1PGI9_9BACT|nr:MAG: FAD-dependent oxidoreductase (4Fe-4S ferredoxin cluster binding protein) [Candidatus Magnetoglobus multicellularis str. Araruama]
MIQAVFMLGGLGIVIGIVLAAASRIFYVYVDPLVEAVDDALPGANCGGCGLPGCAANAEAIVAGKAAPNSCVAGGDDLAATIAAIIGASLEAKEPDIASPGCYYSVDKAQTLYKYEGILDCRAAALMSGGMKVCDIGCLGLGTCVRACPFDALVMGENGLPVVLQEKCTGCGTCERVCPKHIIKLSSVTRRILQEYTIDDCTTPCQRACPAGIDIREYIHQIDQGNAIKAVQVIKERNPFPSTIGRICPHPCEAECRRNLQDEAVAINGLKRFASDYEQASGKRVQPYKAPSTGRTIAVIGGGVEGLSCAFFLARLGHSPTIYEATNQLGGILRKAIARERLPMDILDWDIEGVLQMGVSVEYEKLCSKDFTIPSLLDKGFNAVCLTTGGWDSRLARNAERTIEQQIPGMYLLLDALKINADAAVPINGHCALLANDKMALKASEILKEKGAKQVTILFQQNMEKADISKEAVEQAREKGIRIIFQAAVQRLIGEGETLKQIEFLDMDADFHETIDIDTLFVSYGRYPEMIFKSIIDEDDQKTSQWEAIAPYKQPDQFHEKGLFSEKDMKTDHSAAIRAIGAARRTAASVHHLMYGNTVALENNVLKPESDIQDVTQLNHVDTVPRQIMPQRTAQELSVQNELEKGFTPEMAKIEASRCLQCGLVCYERNV